jgi:hypothetical protein
MPTDNRETLVDRWIKKLKNQPVLAVLIFAGICLGGIASFTEAINKMKNWVAPAPIVTAGNRVLDLSALQIGLDRTFVESRFGPPSQSEKDDGLLRVRYSTLSLDVDFTYDRHDQVVRYYVLTKDTTTRPNIPRLKKADRTEGCLNCQPFDSFANMQPTLVNVGGTAGAQYSEETILATRQGF